MSKINKTKQINIDGEAVPDKPKPIRDNKGFYSIQFRVSVSADFIYELQVKSLNDIFEELEDVDPASYISSTNVNECLGCSWRELIEDVMEDDILVATHPRKEDGEPSWNTLDKIKEKIDEENE